MQSHKDKVFCRPLERSQKFATMQSSSHSLPKSKLSGKITRTRTLSINYFFQFYLYFYNLLQKVTFKAAYSVTFDLLILELMFLFFKNTVKKTKIKVYILQIS